MTKFDPAAPASEWPDARTMSDQEFEAACRKLKDYEAARARQIDQVATLAQIRRLYGVKEEK